MAPVLRSGQRLLGATAGPLGSAPWHSGSAGYRPRAIWTQLPPAGTGEDWQPASSAAPLSHFTCSSGEGCSDRSVLYVRGRELYNPGFFPTSFIYSIVCVCNMFMYMYVQVCVKACDMHACAGVKTTSDDLSPSMLLETGSLGHHWHTRLVDPRDPGDSPVPTTTLPIRVRVL